jgi:hypothetical protein
MLSSARFFSNSSCAIRISTAVISFSISLTASVSDFRSILPYSF